MDRPRALLLLAVLIVTIVAIGLSSHAAIAQETKEVPAFTPIPEDSSSDRVDWGQFMPQNAAPSKPHGDFFESCMLTSDNTLPGTDQRDMCACMAAYKESIDKKPHDMYWTNTIKRRLVTPYETFVTQVFAPCMYLEAFTLSARQCYRESHYANLFANQRAFDNYCTCYADAGEKYVHDYAQPMLAAKMANPTYDEVLHPPDPAQSVMNDIDFRTYMDGKRRQCIGLYQVRMDEPQN